MLTAGPAAAMRNSARAVGASDSISATPPSNQSVMAFTRMPSRWATRLCPSSWARIDPKNKTTPDKPVSQYAAPEKPGAAEGRRLVDRLVR